MAAVMPTRISPSPSLGTATSPSAARSRSPRLNQKKECASDGDSQHNQSPRSPHLSVPGGSAATPLNGNDGIADADSMLFVASTHGHVDKVRFLIERGVDVNHRSGPSLETALMAACRWGHGTIAQMLIAAGADTSIQNADGWTALMFCAFNNNQNLIRLLVRGVVDDAPVASISSASGSSLLSPRAGRSASRGGDRDASGIATDGSLVLRHSPVSMLSDGSGGHLVASASNTLITAGMSPSAMRRAAASGSRASSPMVVSVDYGQSAARRLEELFRAVKAGNAEFVGWLLANEEVNIDARDPQSGLTPLMVAATFSKKSIVSVLLFHGADASVHNRDKQTVLDLVGGDMRHSLISSMCRRHERAPTNKDLLNASWIGAQAVVASVLAVASSHGIDSNYRNCDGYTPLLLATRDMDALKRMNYSEARKGTAFRYGDVIRTLIRSHANVNVRLEADQTTALHFAAGSRQTDVVARLLEGGASVHAIDAHANQPIHIAVASGTLDIVKALFAHGASVNVRGFGGDSPLHIAAVAGNSHAATFLIECGASTTATDVHGKTAMEVCKTDAVRRTLNECLHKRQSIKNGTVKASIQEMVTKARADTKPKLLHQQSGGIASQSQGQSPVTTKEVTPFVAPPSQLSSNAAASSVPSHAPLKATQSRVERVPLSMAVPLTLSDAVAVPLSCGSRTGRVQYAGGQWRPNPRLDGAFNTDATTESPLSHPAWSRPTGHGHGGHPTKAHPGDGDSDSSAYAAFRSRVNMSPHKGLMARAHTSNRLLHVPPPVAAVANAPSSGPSTPGGLPTVPASPRRGTLTHALPPICASPTRSEDTNKAAAASSGADSVAAQPLTRQNVAVIASQPPSEVLTPPATDALTSLAAACDGDSDARRMVMWQRRRTDSEFAIVDRRNNNAGNDPLEDASSQDEHGHLRVRMRSSSAPQPSIRRRARTSSNGSTTSTSSTVSTISTSGGTIGLSGSIGGGGGAGAAAFAPLNMSVDVFGNAVVQQGGSSVDGEVTPGSDGVSIIVSASGSPLSDDGSAQSGFNSNSSVEGIECSKGSGSVALLQAPAKSGSRTRIKPPLSYKLGQVLGKGAFGTVYMGIDERTGEFVAIKRVELANEEAIASLEKEISLLRNLRHPRIVRYLGTDRSEKSSISILMEYVSGGSIAQLIRKVGPIGERVARRYLKQILEGVAYLHENNVMHRDVKSANVLVDSRGSVRLADFGASKLMGSSASDRPFDSGSVMGTPFFLAPEIVRQQSYGLKADVWSVGATALEMLTGNPPYHSMGPVAAIFQIGCGNLPVLPSGVSRECLDFLQRCFEIDPKNRPTAKELIGHPFCSSSD
eukprot:Opistho-2@25115